MKYGYRITMMAAIVAAAIVLGGCGVKPAASTMPAALATPSSTPAVSTAPPTPSPEPTVIATPTPTAPETPGTAGDIPPETESFLRNYSFDAIEEFNVLFSESTTADMDGDGKEETVNLLPTQTKVFGEDELYTAIKVQIGSKEITLQANPGWNFGYTDMALSGTILDFDKEDGAKELLLTQNNYGAVPAIEYIILTYHTSEAKVLARLEYYPEATGTGYILGTELSKTLEGGYSIAIQTVQRYLPDSGFEEVETEIVRALSYTSIPPEQEEGYPTSWDQAVAKQPGEDTADTIKAGTAVYFGMYHRDGWMELHDAEGATLGWLDLNKVDVDKYIGYALQASCH